MRVAIIGSRGLFLNDFEKYLPKETSEILSGGAKGIDSCARAYALSHHIKFTEFLPEYNRYGRAAPLKRNLELIRNSDVVLAFWDGVSHGTKYVIDNCGKMHVPVTVYSSHQINI